MSDSNRMELSGRVTNAPVLRATASGHSVLNLTVESLFSSGPQKGERAGKYSVVLWKGFAEENTGLTKGNRVFLVGRLQNRDLAGPTEPPHIISEIMVDDPGHHTFICQSW